MPNLYPEIIESIKNILNEYHSTLNNIYNYQLIIKADHGLDQRTYNAPTALQVAAIWVEGNDSNESQKRDIIAHSQLGKLQKISEVSGSYDPMQYPLLFPRGQYGWHPGILTASTNNEQNIRINNGNLKKVIARQYYAYKLQTREYSSS
ncbi:6845_t:CDS:2 [Scutellospora calospora]|uniref:6845_t:CDS:1 n=1 Tax=Scutellospora calospora TaxID=85575 RepID=A0ACA9KQ49_9GLOM|nr:6845_t:CDS:2 [Scutellospora calospora]